MQKKKIYITAAYIFLALISISILYNLSFQTTGFIIYSAQPDPTEGKDNYLRQNSFTNYGTSTTLRLGTATTAGGVEFRPLLYFDTSTIPSDNTVINANISIYTTSSSITENFTLNLYRLTSNWTEDDSNWYNKTTSTNWASVGSDYDTEIIASTLITNQAEWHTFTITVLARNWVNGTFANYGLLLYAPDASVGNWTELISSDNTNTTLRPKIKIDYTSNAAPTINQISSDSSASSPTQTGDDVTFQINWSDLENHDTQIFICNSSSITISGCTDTTYCSTSLASTNPSTCSYTVQASDNATMSFYVEVCDALNCSAVSAENFFYTNHYPTLLLIQPDGGETLNQSQGNYSIKFNVSDEDSDSLYTNIYYGSTQNSTTNSIATNLNLSLYCTDSDTDTATTNNCTYSWNTTGIYTTAFLTIVLNDTFTTLTDSSSSSFDILGIEDTLSPQIITTSIDSSTHSGKSTQVNATITDDTIITAWLSLNYTATNTSMTNTSATEFNTTFFAPAPGTYQYRIYAIDLLGNTNVSEWQTFTSSAPNATILSTTAPSLALPYYTVQVTSQIKANNSLRNLYAYLNTPSGFTFLNDYPQNTYLGNFTDNETKTATWFLSVPITEATYTLNATFSDGYTNEWVGSNAQIQVTSAVGGGYEISVAGSPEIAASESYYVESYFKQSGSYTAPDSMEIIIYDSAGNPQSSGAMTNEQTGIYNYTYAVGAAPMSGIWETIVNATKSGTSYYAHEFWKVVGALFDVRDITIHNSSIADLNISVILENIGNNPTDLFLEWNLTRVDTGTSLDSGQDTIGVGATPITKYISPSISYVGQVKIAFLGTYLDTEQAAAYEIFSTTSGEETPEPPPSSGGGGGGGGGSTTQQEEIYSLEFLELEKIISLIKNIESIFEIQISNTGTQDITNLQLTIENLEAKYYTISPATITKLESGKTDTFEIKIIVTDFIGEKDATLKISSSQITKTEDIIIEVLNIEEYLKKKIEELTKRIIDLNKTLIEEEKESLLPDLADCEDILEELKDNFEKEEFINAKDNAIKTEECIDEVEKTSSRLKQLPFIGIKIMDYLVWIIAFVLIIILIVVIYILTKKISLVRYTKKRRAVSQQKTEAAKAKLIESKLKTIKERLR